LRRCRRYAVRDYTAVNPEFGTMDDFKRLVKQAPGLACA